MNKLEKETRHKNSSMKTVSKSFKFEPELNGTHRIKFAQKYLNAGFAVLLKGGMFHRFTDAFVVTEKHCKLLDEAKIPYKILSN
jgi:hypothetical protein